MCTLCRYTAHNHMTPFVCSQKGQSPSRSLGSLTEEDDEASLEKSHSRLPVTSECRVVYKEHDSTIGSFCVNSVRIVTCRLEIPFMFEKSLQL